MREDLMRHPLHFALLIFSFCLAVSGSNSARADGGIFITEESTRTEEVPGGTQASAALDGLISSNGQRAVLWQTDEECWDLYVDPGTVEISGAAWLMPLPVVPEEVGPASSEFIDELDAATQPLLITNYTRVIEYYRYEYHSTGGGGGCLFGAADSAAGWDEEVTRDGPTEDGGSENEGLDEPVHVWQAGRLGDVEYEILTADDAASLEAWLVENGYVVPEDLPPLLTEYVREGAAFFAARMSRSPTDAVAIPTFRFSLCGVDAPTYPLRLTTLSVAERLNFTLWLVTESSSSRYVPSNADIGYFGSFYQEEIHCGEDYEYAYQSCEYDPLPDFAQSYADRRQELYEAIGGRRLAVEYAAELDEEAVDQRIDALRGEMSDFPLARNSEDWTEELRDITGHSMQVQRFSGSFRISAMYEDILFETGAVTTIPGVYEREVYQHSRESDPNPPEDDPDEEEDTSAVFDDASSCGMAASSRRHVDSQTLSIIAMLLLGFTLALRRLRRRS